MVGHKNRTVYSVPKTLFAIFVLIYIIFTFIYRHHPLVGKVYAPILCVSRAYIELEIKCIGNSKLVINHRDFAFIMFSRYPPQRFRHRSRRILNYTEPM